MQDIKDQLETYKREVDEELDALLAWWKTFTIDEEQGGFYGEVDNHNKAVVGSPKGLVLNSRILWTFSAAYLLKGNQEDLGIATRAFQYIDNYFYDSQNGGFYWSLTPSGETLDGKKQIYGQAFAIYGLSEYYKATGDERALSLAKETFLLLQKHSFDPVNFGYVEAFSQTWQTQEDLRLSEKDLNAEKSMNTHLHIIEAYANLYLIDKDERLAKSIKDLLFVFKHHIITMDHHLSLFFSNTWQPKSAVISYGHDIEAAWLLQECAQRLGDDEELAEFKSIAISLCDATREGVDEDGGMYYEFDAGSAHLVREKHWWPQAEAMVGFFNAYALSENSEYLMRSIKSWSFIKKNLKDLENGEWYWGLYPDGTVMKESKAGFWKCPYHNVRACMQILIQAQAVDL